MTVETSTTINGLNAALPAGTDLKSEGDNHMRLLKSVLQAVFNDATTGVMQLVAAHVKAGLLAGTKQGIELDDAGDSVRLRLTTDPTLAAANGLLELFDSLNASQKSIAITKDAITLAGGVDAGDVLTTGNSFYKGGAAFGVNYPIGSVVLAIYGHGVAVPRNSAMRLVEPVGGYGFIIAETGTQVPGAWVNRGGFSVAPDFVYLCQRIA